MCEGVAAGGVKSHSGVGAAILWCSHPRCSVRGLGVLVTLAVPLSPNAVCGGAGGAGRFGVDMVEAGCTGGGAGRLGVDITAVAGDSCSALSSAELGPAYVQIPPADEAGLAPAPHPYLDADFTSGGKT